MKLYSSLASAVRKDQQNLTPFLLSLHDSINLSDSSLVFDGHNQHQLLAQVYSHLQRPLAQLKRQVNQIVPEGESFHEEEEEEHQSDNNEGAIDEEQEEEIEEEDDMGEGEYDEKIQQSQESNEEKQIEFDEEVMEGEEDIGLYGQQLDSEEMQSYENEGMSQDDPQFERQFKDQFKDDEVDEQEDQNEEAIEDNFDHFREVQLQNEEAVATEEKSKIQTQIQDLQNKALTKKDWTLQGEVRAKERPVNSLLEHDLQFNSGLKYKQQVTQQHNEDLEKVIKQRILDELFDDRRRLVSAPALREHFGSLKDVSTEKSEKGLAELYELEFKNYLGLGEKKNDKLKKDIMEGFKEINYHLDCLSNLNFTPKPTPAKNSYKKNEQAIIVEEKVPITMVGREEENEEKKNFKFQSEKQINKKGKRLKNKRISRLRKKEQTKKKLNRIIEYGGMTKHEAEVQKKMMKNKQDKSGIKYSKSSSFFQGLNTKGTKAGKPNPNISKMKI